MEKHQSRSLAKRMPLVNEDSFTFSQPVVGRQAETPDNTERAKNKPSREDVSRCINIWASMYLTGNEKAEQIAAPENGDLRLPARPWMGRNPGSLKRFD